VRNRLTASLPQLTSRRTLPRCDASGRRCDTSAPALASSTFVNPSAQHGGPYEGRYGPMAVAKLVQCAGTGAEVTGRHFPHRWRHSYATSLLRRGADIHVVQRLMGHSNIATTTRYLHLSDADLTDAVDKAFPAE
jgi:site-specific recombinase XerC